MHGIIVLLLFFCTIALSTVQQTTAVTINWDPVGNPGNAPDTSGLGAVPYTYQIAGYDVTNAQYVEFLNAKDAGGSNLLGLWNPEMADPKLGGIDFNAGNSSGTKYTAINGDQNHPVNSVTWYDAVRFANWINNGQGSGDTETGAYTLGALNPDGTPITPPLTHNVGAKIWIPTENEWYKAAYYDPRSTAQGGPPSDSHYWQYPTSSNLPPTATGPLGAPPNSANYNSGAGGLTDVGAYTATMSPSGAFDMAGNVFEWNEALISGSLRSARGGTFNSSLESLLSSYYEADGATSWDFAVGFRLASVPEPSTAVLAVMAWGLMWTVLQRRHSAIDSINVRQRK